MSASGILACILMAATLAYLGGHLAVLAGWP